MGSVHGLSMGFLIYLAYCLLVAACLRLFTVLILDTFVMPVPLFRDWFFYLFTAAMCITIGGNRLDITVVVHSPGFEWVAVLVQFGFWLIMLGVLIAGQLLADLGVSKLRNRE